MRALIFLVAIVLILALAGWISFGSKPGQTSINLETDRIEQDTDRALQSGAMLLKKASDSVDPATQPEPAVPPASTPPPMPITQ